MSLPEPLDRLRQPEYTGENRCLPCTLLNVAIAVLLAVSIAAPTWLAAGTAPAAVAGALTIGISLGTIAIRGYLVPGTPRLTETHLPDWVRRRFHDRSAGIDDGADLELAMKGVGPLSDGDADRREASVGEGEGDENDERGGRGEGDGREE